MDVEQASQASAEQQVQCSPELVGRSRDPAPQLRSTVQELRSALDTKHAGHGLRQRAGENSGRCKEAMLRLVREWRVMVQALRAALDVGQTGHMSAGEQVR